MAMQRDGHSDDRTKAGVSGRTPPVIEGEAVEVAGAPEPAAAESIDLAGEIAADESDAAQMTSETERDESAQPENGGPADAIAAPPPRKTRRGAVVAVLGFLVVAIAGAVAWLATPGQHGVAGDLRSRVVALLPDSAQRALHLKSAPAAEAEKPATPSQAEAGKPEVTNSDAARPTAPKPEASASEAANTQAANTQAAKSEGAKSEATATEAPRSEPVKQAVAEPKPSESSTQQPAATGEAKEGAAPASGGQSPAAQTSIPQVAGAGALSSVDAKQIDDLSVKLDGLQKTVDAL
ncbi:MAG: hypothetical protein KDJ40_17460, partial [Hyphomicrobiales bacterium]|nr:hypothetical protein [Hyphomicrobiales bacterium]